MFICYRPLAKRKSPKQAPRFINQQGSSIVLALFVIIVLTLLGSVLMRMLSTSSESVSQEVLGTRAYMAANSALQGELQRVFPLNNAVGICNASNVFSYDFQTSSSTDIPGLYDCSATTTCTNYHTDIVNNVKYYRLTSTGECGSGTMAANSKVLVKSSRTLQIEARSL